ncbi:MAG: maleylacetoacetate isomerase, partial [Pseudomonadota bacterium]
RVRIGLNLKGLSPERHFVHLTKGGGQQFAADFTRMNPQQLVPVLVDGEEAISQSLAILEYLDETHPAPSFLPGSAADRARIRALSLAIACDLHPLNNLRVLFYLRDAMAQTEEARNAWYRHWVAKGLAAFETALATDRRTGAFCHGDAPTLADICLVPQIFNAKRFDCPLDAYPTVMRVFDACMKVPAFDAAQPGKQPDAE